MPASQQYDAVIIGGGPAGASAATVLADHGRRVVLLEKDRFPRYRVGESLLPFCYFPLERLGVLEKLDRCGFIQKHSVQFVNVAGRVSQPFYFFEYLKHDAAQTWQVVRSEFDQMLLEHARERGAEVHHDTVAKQFITDNGIVGGVTAKGPDGDACTFRAPMTIDCSGRDGFAVNRNDWRIRDPHLSRIAIWTYFRGAMRDPGLDAGATTVAYLPDKGWFWYIPLPDDIVSVGITAQRDYLYREGKDLAAIFERERHTNQWIEQHLAGAERVQDFRVTSDYSYRSRYCAADGLVLAGDALAFLDPVFSSGVFLALQSGVLVGDAVDAALRAGDVSAARFADYGQHVSRGMEAMRQLVYAFYDQTFSFGRMLGKFPHLRGDLTDCLIGNLFKDFGPLFEAIGEFADLPAPADDGGAVVTSGTASSPTP